MMTIELSDLDQAVWFRGGSVLPILAHEGCMALMSCINNPINIEVYPDASGNAYGEMYLDDGQSFEF